MLPLALAAWLVSAACLSAQVPSAIFGSDTRLVHVDIQVTQRHSGRIVRGLVKEDFEVQDEGQARPIAVFESEALPLDAVLLMDTAGQVGRNPLGDYTAGLQAVVQQFRDGDRLAVVSVGAGEVLVRTGLTSEEGALGDAISETLRDRAKLRRGRARLIEALEQAASLFGARTAETRRRVVLALTHNRAKPDRKKMSRATTALLEADATVLGLVVAAVGLRRGVNVQSGVLFPRRQAPSGGHVPAGPETLPEEGSLESAVEQTGGELQRYGPNMAISWPHVINRVRSRYLAAFYAPSSARPGEVRRIAVRLTEEAARKCGDCVVRARSRYTVK